MSFYNDRHTKILLYYLKKSRTKIVEIPMASSPDKFQDNLLVNKNKRHYTT